jgi:secernin
MGANEYAVVIGNEAVWTQDPAISKPGHLPGMDLVRLGLERGSTAREALDVITTLLETHGQVGACAENDPSFTYHNSYLIVDGKEAWVLETSGCHWVAEKVTSGVRNISNCLSIRSSYDLASQGIQEYAREMGYWKKDGPHQGIRVSCLTSRKLFVLEVPRKKCQIPDSVEGRSFWNNIPARAP